jgi:signal transduction histidine kinase
MGGDRTGRALPLASDIIGGDRLRENLGASAGARLARARRPEDPAPVLLRLFEPTTSAQAARFRREFERLQSLDVRERGFFISGKFDQYQRDIPYSAIVQAFRELVIEILAEGEPRIAAWKQRLLGRDNEVTPAHPLMLALGRVRKEGARVSDIVLGPLARKTAEAENRAKTEFLRNMSHELRTPLNAVLGYAQLLKRSPGLEDRQVTGLNTIQQSGQHLLTLLDDLLDLARIEAGRLELSPRRTKDGQRP